MAREPFFPPGETVANMPREEKRMLVRRLPREKRVQMLRAYAHHYHDLFGGRATKEELMKSAIVSRYARWLGIPVTEAFR